MNLLVPLKMVPDLVEELTLNEAGTGLDRDALTYKLNEFDDQALEEALELQGPPWGHRHRRRPRHP